MGQRILIVGGAVAGPAAAIAARDADPNAEIVLLDRERHVGFAAGALPYYLSKEIRSLADLLEQPPEHLRKAHGIDVRLGVELLAVEPEKKRILVEVKGEQQSLPYDKLVVATGARSLWPTLPPSNAPNVFGFRSPGDGKGVDGILRKRRGGRVAVVGGGAMGLEAAEGFRRAGCQVAVIEKSSHVLDGDADGFHRLVEERLRKAGARLHRNATVAAVSVDKSGAIKTLTLSSRAKLQVDLVVVTSGSTPNAEILLAAGAQEGPSGSVLVDSALRTCLPDVFAAGACAALPHAITGEPVWLAQAGPAFRSGRAAGHNAATTTGDPLRASVLETSLLRVFDSVSGRTGLDEAAAARFLGGEPAVGRIETTLPARDACFRDQAPLRLRLLFAKADGRILGAQAFGTAGVDKLLDTLATAITAGMRLAQLAGLDLCYSPPFAPLPHLLARLPVEKPGPGPA
ncbi:MAG: FAD-dependent oxidoreductase [Deltaproteobacteria bacterium]|nr:FAD-dependent oxidoreductase [Deltaproteobacteria bacterium]